MLLNPVNSSVLPNQTNACHLSKKHGQYKQDLGFCPHFNSCMSIWYGKEGWENRLSNDKVKQLFWEKKWAQQLHFV